MFVKYLVGKPNPNYKPSETSLYQEGDQFKIYSDGEVYRNNEYLNFKKDQVIDILRTQAEFGKCYHFKITKNIDFSIQENEYGAFEFIGFEGD